MKSLIYIFNLACVISLSTYGYAISTEVVVTGNLISSPPDCTVNTDKQERIEFGDILLTRIDGNNYKKELPFYLSCKPSLAKNQLKITFEGGGANFNSTALKTSNSKLGVIFYVNSMIKPINQPINIDVNNLPKIKVAPIKDTSSGFLSSNGGGFTAVATLKVEYQ